MNRKDLRRLARIRLKEARVLLKARCFDGAYYLCGYAVECGLKACIAKGTRRSEFPELERVKRSYTHSFPGLVTTAVLEALLRAEEATDVAFSNKWSIARVWTEAARYVEHAEEEARELYRAVADRQHGVMRWIRRHW